MKIKALLYCTKAKPILRDYRGKAIYNRFVISPTDRPFTSDDTQPILNGKIVAECDFEVEEIRLIECNTFMYDVILNFETETLTEDELCKQSCLNASELNRYLDLYKEKEIYGYAIHIKNLHIFDEPKELDYYYSRPKKINTFEWYRSKGYDYVNITLDKAPQNMMYCCTESGKDYVLISIQPQWLCKILNGEKTIEIRKKVLKEMLKNE